MGNLKPNQIVGIILLVAMVLLFIPVPLVDEKSAASVAILICAIYLLIKK